MHLWFPFSCLISNHNICSHTMNSTIIFRILVWLTSIREFFYQFQTNVIYLFLLLNQRDIMSSSAHYQNAKNLFRLFSWNVLWCNLISFSYQIIWRCHLEEICINNLKLFRILCCVRFNAVTEITRAWFFDASAMTII